MSGAKLQVYTYGKALLPQITSDQRRVTNPRMAMGTLGPLAVLLLSLTASFIRAAPASYADLARGHGSSADDDDTCFEEDCRSSPFIMHASKTTNTSEEVTSCFQFVAIGCYAAPKGCCPEVARRFSALEFAISECG